jgi:uncharacterized protein YpiB (UPF0302 family)
MTVSVAEELRNTQAELARCEEALLDHEHRANTLEVRLRHSDSAIDARDTELFHFRSD